MKRKSLRRFARREDLALPPAEFALLRRLSTPQKTQSFVNAIPINHELGGETVPFGALGDPASLRALHRGRHVCRMRLVGAWRAAASHASGLHLSDYPHVVALFRRGLHWGAISKTNGASLRYRDPIYRSLRELALSYFHEYSDPRGRKTVRSFSAAFDMRRIDPKLWVTNGDNCQHAHDVLEGLRHYRLISLRQERLLARRDPFERRASKLIQYPRPTSVVD